MNKHTDIGGRSTSQTVRKPLPSGSLTCLLTRNDLKRLGISLSNTQLIRLERDGRFPRRVYLTPARVVWLESEILEWIEARAAERAHRVYSEY